MTKSFDIEKNKETIIYLLETTKREGIDKLINFLKESDFFIAPASKKYHLAVPGGLAYHSLCVHNVFNKLCDTYICDKVPYVSLKIASLLHDVCKINRYAPYTSPYKTTPDYEYKPDTLPIGHGEKSVIIIQKYIKLTDQEIAMIRWHMAMYEPPFDKYSFAIQNTYPEAIMLYFADHIATLFVEKATVKDGYY